MSKVRKTELSPTAKLSNLTQLPFDMTTGLPYIKMFSNREVLIEDAGKLIHYENECVKVRQKRNTVVINGCDLKLIYLVNKDLRVTGFISGVCFE